MTERHDAAWSVWEPLIEEVRPKGKTPSKNLRRTISAIFWRHQNGAKWRALPSEFGPWWTPHSCSFAGRSSVHGSASLKKVGGADPELGMVFLDGTTIRAHHKTVGAAKRGDYRMTGATFKFDGKMLRCHRFRSTNGLRPNSRMLLQERQGGYNEHSDAR